MCFNEFCACNYINDWEQDMPVFRFYPNPARNHFVIEPTDMQAGQVKLELADSRGDIVVTWQLTSAPATLSLPEGISPGLY